MSLRLLEFRLRLGMSPAVPSLAALRGCECAWQLRDCTQAFVLVQRCA